MHTDAIREVYAAEGPFVSLYLDAHGDTEDATTQYDVRWRNLLRELEERGLDAATREAISAARGTPAGGGTRVILAANGAVHLATSLPSRPAAETVDIQPLPYVLPLVDADAGDIPHLVVRIDRSGADVQVYAGNTRPADSDTVTGPDQAHISKANAGGWSHRGYQASSEAEWQHNAKEVAERVTGLAAGAKPAVIVAAGDARALNYFTDALPQQLRDVVTVVEGSRGTDGGDDALAERVRQTVDDHVMGRTVDLLEHFAQERGQHDRACEGVDDTIEALRKAQVETLILTDELDHEATMWVGTGPTVLGRSAGDVTALGGEPREARVVDALPWAAIGTGADVRVVTGGMEQEPREGVGAVLRYADR